MTTIEVIIPVRNMPVHIAECVGALRKQLCNGDALTVVDDGSTDETATVATELGARVRSIADSRGPYFARQVAARTAVPLATNMCVIAFEHLPPAIAADAVARSGGRLTPTGHPVIELPPA